MPTVEIVRIDGSKEMLTTNARGTSLVRFISQQIGCDTCDVVNLRDGRMMSVDDTGLLTGKPRNEAATKIVQAIYPLYKQRDVFIAGDVAIALDEDFA